MQNSGRDDRPIERILISRATPGMEVARDVYSRNGQVILNAGAELDSAKISKLMFYSVDSVTVYKKNAPDKMTLAEQMRNSVEFREFTRKYDDACNALQDIMTEVIDEGKEVDEDRILSEVDSIIEGAGSRSRIFNLLHCIHDYDELTYMHSVKVSLICNCFGGWLNMSESERKTLTLAGLLHDIGKTQVPQKILQKPDSLTAEEYRIIQTHAIKGYEILKDKKIDDRIKLAALQHHERYDRSGYPYGKSGDELNEFSMIISIADVYDAMTSDRVYRPRICPFEVVGNLESEGLGKYAPKFLIPLLENIAEVYMNHTVRLSDDRVGQVVLLNKSELSKPIVKVDDGFVDLSKKRDIKISEIL